MPFVDFVSLRNIIKILLVILFSIVDHRNTDIGLNRTRIQFYYSLETSPSHLVLPKIEKTVSHSDSSLNRQGFVRLQTFFIKIQSLLIISLYEIDLSQH